jgi:hypothetical protein
MPITGTAPALTAQIKADLIAAAPESGILQDSDALEILISTICTRMISHLISNGLITVTVATTGTATEQTGGGTGTIS